ncbi:hypothetical protein MHU86_17645 [Fragilaria crotonensis]|nr:hypothetical protein MHU86_17645 [Fragilaria crotonensis]
MRLTLMSMEKPTTKKVAIAIHGWNWGMPELASSSWIIVSVRETMPPHNRKTLSELCAELARDQQIGCVHTYSHPITVNASPNWMHRTQVPLRIPCLSIRTFIRHHGVVQVNLVQCLSAALVAQSGMTGHSDQNQRLPAFQAAVCKLNNEVPGSFAAFLGNNPQQHHLQHDHRQRHPSSQR